MTVFFHLIRKRMRKFMVLAHIFKLSLTVKTGQNLQPNFQPNLQPHIWHMKIPGNLICIPEHSLELAICQSVMMELKRVKTPINIAAVMIVCVCERAWVGKVWMGVVFPCPLLRNNIVTLSANVLALN